MSASKKSNSSLPRWSESGGLSEWWKGEDVNDERVYTMTIEDVVQREIKNKEGDTESKWTITFKQDSRSLILNKINGAWLAKNFGDDMGSWVGQNVCLFGVETPFGPGIRLRKAKRRPSAEAASEDGDR